MKIVKQRATLDGTVGMDCAVCVIAMLTDLPYEKVLADNPNYRLTSDHDLMRYMHSQVKYERVRKNPTQERTRRARTWC